MLPDTDLYSLCVVLYNFVELMTPIDLETVHRLNDTQILF